MGIPADISWPVAIVWVAILSLQAWQIWLQRTNHALMNSRLSELQAQTERAAHSAGIIQGVKDEQERIKLDLPQLVDPVHPNEAKRQA